MILYGFWRHIDVDMNRAMNVVKLGSQIDILLYINSRIFEQ